MELELVFGDITKANVDTIVNAAKDSLLGGSGVDGAIHRAAGPGLHEECVKFNGCPTGQARLTLGYNLTAKYVIHAVGPLWRGGLHGEEELLRQTYLSVLEIADSKKFTSIAIPAISCGAYRFPKTLACRIAVECVVRFAKRHKYPKRVIFTVLDPTVYETYQNLLIEVVQKQKEFQTTGLNIDLS